MYKVCGGGFLVPGPSQSKLKMKKCNFKPVLIVTAHHTRIQAKSDARMQELVEY